MDLNHTAFDHIETRVFADGADPHNMLALVDDPRITGFTTNPSLLRRAGVKDYSKFAHEILKHVTEHPVSFEVLADDIDEIYQQANTIAAWGDNVYVKIPVTNANGDSTLSVVRSLSANEIKLNVTAICTEAQLELVADSLVGGAPAYASVFAGRIADTGVDPLPIISAGVSLSNTTTHMKIIWASAREVFNLVQADSVGCHVITMNTELLSKLGLLGKDLHEVSLETVQMFREDAQASGLAI